MVYHTTTTITIALILPYELTKFISLKIKFLTSCLDLFLLHKLLFHLTTVIKVSHFTIPGMYKHFRLLYYYLHTLVITELKKNEYK